MLPPAAGPSAIHWSWWPSLLKESSRLFLGLRIGDAKRKKKKKQIRDEAGMNWFGREGEREGGIYHGEPGDSSGPGPDDSAFSSCSARAPCCCCCCYRGGGGWRGETEDGDDNEEVEEGA